MTEIKNKKIIVIVNPASAGGKTALVWSNKRQNFLKEIFNIKESFTKKQGDAVEIAKKAVEMDYSHIMAVGGDGTINEIINGMLKADVRNLNTKLVIYSQGTGSDLKRTLNLAQKADQIIKKIKTGSSKNIKVVKAEYLNHDNKKEKRFFINAADCGMGAEVAKKLNEKQKIKAGNFNYLLRIFQVLFNYKNKEMRIEIDDKLIYKGKINTAVAARGNYFGGGIKIAPEADLFSDKLNLLLLKDFSKLGIIFNLIKGYKGNHLSHPLVESYLCQKIKITSKEKLKLEIDGESVGSTDLIFEISNKAISVIV